ncbi:HlyD family efflux transporter periplasmic adaptor subunit [Clostridium sp. Marseille-P299]|uniref:HlyD family efflux transporter periplasmic adaptor subunit n=1 Tax=Clostridium sp. Marseille-P299 TaxID=1805477 RepID=UPI00082C3C26|nr:HlyD family efflux transporter periplasmic adaptor subunit [Clostridium sp. Marseille-P299]
MPRKSNVVKIKKRKNVNIGVIIFLIIAVYLVVNIYLFITKNQISIFEVKEESLAKDTIVTGVIIRDEKIIKTPKAGYVNYYQREGSRVAKNATIYSIDESKKIYEKLSDQGEAAKISTKDVNSIKKEISRFKKAFSEESFSEVYSFKDEIKSKIQEAVDMTLLDNMQDIINSTGITSSFEVNKTSQSGIISYRVDSLSNLTVDKVTADTFNMENYTKTNLRTVDIAEANAPVYKLITDDSWSIVAPISSEIYNDLKEREKIKFTVLEDDFTITAPMSLTENGSEYYIQIDLDEYMVRYINERFLEIDLNISSESGYKIPLSAITQKQFYTIPKSYLTNGGDSNELGIIVESYDTSNGNVNYVFTPTTVYYEDEESAYIGKDAVTEGTYIYNPTTKERSIINTIGTLEGVFNVNKGYAVFRRIERITENDAYCIIEKGTKSGVSLYDHIALDASSVIENAIIY